MSDPYNPAREDIEQSESVILTENGTLITSEQSRPLYFDGRFLKAEDLISEQTYFLKRQATLNRANGFGVVRGLEVTEERTSRFRVVIAKGSGVTPSGESVVLENDLPINLSDTARIAMYDAAMGVAQKTPDAENARESARSQTGVFILGLRLVEYKTGNVPSFPTSSGGLATGTIGTQKGEIVEATAVTLARYSDVGEDRMRSRIAGDIFSGKTIPPEPANMLPLAMIALENNRIQWVDNFLVRRELRNVASGPLGLQTVPRALRFAHLQQYNQQLSEETSPDKGRFSASSKFDSLPAAGRLPRSAVSTEDFSQTYFPPEISVQLTAVPTDEVAALIEDSLVLPPINLRASAAELESLSLLLVIPMIRQALTELKRKLAAASATAAAPQPIPTISSIRFQNTAFFRKPLILSVPGAIAKRNPLQKLYDLKRPKLLRLQPPTNPTDEQSVDDLWQQALTGASELWYVRQRNIPYQSEIVGTAVPLTGDDTTVERQVNERIAELDLTSRFADLQNNAGVIARAEVVSLLGSPQINRSNLLLRSAIRDLGNISPAEPTETDEPSTEANPITNPITNPINRARVARVAERFGDPRLGEGISRLESVAPAIKENEAIVSALADSGDVIALDRVARTLSPSELNTFGRELTTLAQRGNTAEVSSLIRNRLEVVR
ncbi:hypothetical protein [cf. Phormidesmis sp. LEGE 11477]|uniref:hypothetical protein n=1 Tax=cf. Phormidesmis sp. LEGE 11477 TaxID=1828680 RepID=UPI00187E6465|nr:hypothetical protein [cf. Phormidesmis sp. LEGE 11477]MBE9063954.1 hypothetical protein [cf. Phormidesmis sp. LEGE 11477]